MKFQDVPPLTRTGSYCVDVSWQYLLEHLDQALHEDGLILLPDFQRGHVWTEAQQVAFVEYGLREGAVTGKDLYFNHPGWMYTFQGDYVIVDGLQRLTAVTRFLRNEIKAYGYFYREFTGNLRVTQASFRWHVNDLKTRAEVLRWYLEFNSAGTPHSSEELERVRELLAKESP